MDLGTTPRVPSDLHVIETCNRDRGTVLIYVKAGSRTLRQP